MQSAAPDPEGREGLLGVKDSTGVCVMFCPLPSMPQGKSPSRGLAPTLNVCPAILHLLSCQSVSCRALCVSHSCLWHVVELDSILAGPFQLGKFCGGAEMGPSAHLSGSSLLHSCPAGKEKRSLLENQLIWAL